MRNEYEEAEGRYEEALPLYEAIGDRLGQANTGAFNGWGDIMDQFKALAQQFLTDDMVAVTLMGSHARGEAQHYSDIDLVCFVRSATTPEPDTHYVDRQLVVVSYVTTEQTEAWFTEPKQVVEVMRNLQQAKPLIDRTGTFAQLQQRAQEFQWTPAHQRKADAYAANQMIELIEEVHKGLNGLTQYHVGRLINASHGLAWGLTYAALVQKGVLASGDNGLLADAQTAMGRDSEWSQEQRRAFGIGSSLTDAVSLVEQTKASLRLYRLTYAMLQSVCKPGDCALIEKTISLAMPHL
jgi:hypothetical protein